MQNIPWEALKRLAKEVQTHAYAPYSQLKVGAAVWTGSHIFSGCNVENASFGLTVCAERHAVACAVAQAERPKALVVFSGALKPVVPCGACRQVLLEFSAADLPILCCTHAEQQVFSLGELLPFAFEKTFLKPTS